MKIMTWSYSVVHQSISVRLFGTYIRVCLTYIHQTPAQTISQIHAY